MNALWEMLFAAAGSLGFSLIFQVRGKRVFVCAVLGGAVWGIFLLVSLADRGDLLSYFCAAMAVTTLSELLARIMRCPSPIFLVPGVVPLIPGGSLFYTMESLVRGDGAAAGAQGIKTAAVAGVIALGIYAISTLFRLMRVRRRAPQKR